jgi:AcrR family transcriptional regulator
MPTTAADLREVALVEFAASGYQGTSLQTIAERAGVSKASVLYHYSSKEQLLEAVLTPALDRVEEILQSVAQLRRGGKSRTEFLETFVDFLLEHRLAVHIFVNQAGGLVDVPVVDRANREMQRFADYFQQHTGSVEEQVRFGIALGGAAYLLASDTRLGDGRDVALLRPALLQILSELLAPVPSN